MPATGTSATGGAPVRLKSVTIVSSVPPKAEPPNADCARQPSAAPAEPRRTFHHKGHHHVTFCRTNQQGHCGLSSCAERHRLAGSPGCVVVRAHRASLEALRRSRERPSFAARAAEDGQPAPSLAQLLEEFRCGPLQDADRAPRHSQVIFAFVLNAKRIKKRRLPAAPRNRVTRMPQSLLHLLKKQSGPFGQIFK